MSKDVILDNEGWALRMIVHKIYSYPVIYCPCGFVVYHVTTSDRDLIPNCYKHTANEIPDKILTTFRLLEQ